jgi:hypothetical protein
MTWNNVQPGIEHARQVPDPPTRSQRERRSVWRDTLVARVARDIGAHDASTFDRVANSIDAALSMLYVEGARC